MTSSLSQAYCTKKRFHITPDEGADSKKYNFNTLHLVSEKLKLKSEFIVVFSLSIEIETISINLYRDRFTYNLIY